MEEQEKVYAFNFNFDHHDQCSGSHTFHGRSTLMKWFPEHISTNHWPSQKYKTNKYGDDYVRFSSLTFLIISKIPNVFIGTSTQLQFRFLVVNVFSKCRFVVQILSQFYSKKNRRASNKVWIFGNYASCSENTGPIFGSRQGFCFFVVESINSLLEVEVFLFFRYLNLAKFHV